MEVPGPVLTRAQVRAADARAASLLGLPTLLLMENAGRGLADVTMSMARLYGMDGAVVVAASGNNGGDGLVAARHLRRLGLPVRILLASTAAKFGPDSDAGRNLAAARALGIPVDEAADAGALARVGPALPSRHLLVDAVLGTGLEGPVRGPTAAVLDWMRGGGRPVVAADLPSGLDADTGEPLGPVPRCVATATYFPSRLR